MRLNVWRSIQIRGQEGQEGLALFGYGLGIVLILCGLYILCRGEPTYKEVNSGEAKGLTTSSKGAAYGTPAADPTVAQSSSDSDRTAIGWLPGWLGGGGPTR